MDDATLSFLRRVYKEYYYRNAAQVEFPAQIESREFGYIPFGGSMIRHLSFKDRGQLVAELVKQAPSSVYCSNARYSYPAQPMEEKEWKGAELIFDIDATDIPTSCKRTHDSWYCTTCHSSGRLPRPAKCTKCGGTTFEFHGSCEACLGAAKGHAVRVTDFLVNEFGVDIKDVRVYFSGNRGYHLHVFDERFDTLNQQARLEVGEYIRGTSLPHIQTIASIFRKRRAAGASERFGWMGRIAAAVETNPNFTGTMQKLVSETISRSAALIDLSVTTDIHRVFRLAGTLHGNTGMLKMRLNEVSSFDPSTDPVVLGSEIVRLKVSFFPRFTMMGNTFGPFKDSMASLPAYAAVNVLTRGLGEVL